ncbi:peroxiredoxin-like family protein [Bradyrhizobium elkanii]|uniref:peroxiredoxin-like family protein n=1 Tax=Bradyrhizobium elkanii TaxID=29448 RepID=UPI000841E356|nr:peroxiredoxin-like family protein [Bradyrhizobium elkanii]ODM77089.1 alkyl hydroperoxide reductase [Bradyrhizobium elkanii]ODM84113.1 alkyl hydroperoxide reductase [Bradyrhizobium elkanii]
MSTRGALTASHFQPIDSQPDDTKPMLNQTNKTLARIRTELLTTFGAADWESYNYLVRWLQESDVASHALKVGDHAPNFLLPDSDGCLHSSEELRRKGPLVLSFFRGGWCPFCTAELCALQAAKDEFESVGATLAVVTPETRDFPRQLKRSLGLDLKVLSDVDYGVAISYGVLFRVPDETKAHYSALGFDFGARHGSPEWMLPIPATYVIDAEGRIRSAFVEPDFTIRAEPAQILASLRQAASTSG